MKIALLTFGTRGDVQPYLALAKALQSRGHTVRLAAPANFREWVGAHGVPFHSMGTDIEQLIRSPAALEAMSGNWLRVVALLREQIIPMVRASLDATADAGMDADVLVYHPKAVGAEDVAEATGAVLIGTSPFPLRPTGEFPLLLFRGSYGRVLNRLSWSVWRFARTPYASLINTWRKDKLGLGKARQDSRVAPVMHLCAVSPTVFAKPGDWGEHEHVTGYWFLNESAGWQPDEALAEFLRDGPPPIYIGLGSMPTRDPAFIARRFIDAVTSVGARALIATGWGGMTAVDTPSSVLAMEGAPHDFLFRHVSAVIHHGGAGTTAAALRAGKPSLVFPQTADQPFWGRRVVQLGCGPMPLTRRLVRSHHLIDRIRSLVSETAYRTRAETVAAAISSEDGLATSVALIEAAARVRQSRGVARRSSCA